jgi:glycosyltransferase involved in cell wall biosynthesis
MDSVRQTNPDVDLYALVIGLDQKDSRDAVLNDVRLLSEKDILTSEEMSDMPFIYDLLEFATSLKPFTFKLLLSKQKYKTIIYLDPDIEVYQSLSPVFEELKQHSIVVTPHVLAPIPEDGLLPNSADISLAGIYNLGFIGVRNDAMAFIDWWCDRLKFDCISDPPRGLFVDQKWIDWAPALFNVRVLKDPSLNVAYWNIHERDIGTMQGEESKSEFAVNGGTLTFFHFSGFDPDRPETLSRHSRLKERVSPSDNETLMSLCRAYALRIRHFEQDSGGSRDYAYSEISPGVPATKPTRRALRNARTGGYLKISDRERPASDSAAFVSWLRTPQGSWSLTPLEVGLWLSREDLRLGQQNLDMFSARRLREWSKASSESAVESNLLGVSVAPANPEVARRKLPPHNPYAGVSVLAYANAEMGVGEGGRRLFAAIRQTGIPSELVGLRDHSSRDEHRLISNVREFPSFRTVVSVVNADQAPIVSSRFDLKRNASRHIGYWAWELEDFPSKFKSGIDAVDEIWTMSTFIQKAIEAKTDKRVNLVPNAFKPPGPKTSFTRDMLGLPNDKFVFLTSFDYLSVPRRKNPESTIKAYVAAFRETDGACLIVKSINSNQNPNYQTGLRDLASNRKDVVFIDKYLSDIENIALIELADCFISLHRSEGFGLNMADAMSLGTPVVATNYGGNLDFMSNQSTALVDYEVQEVGEGSWPYNPDSLWAEPSIIHAAHQMSKVFTQESYRENLVRESRKIAYQFSSAEVSAKVLGLLNCDQ